MSWVRWLWRTPERPWVNGVLVLVVWTAVGLLFSNDRSVAEVLLLGCLMGATVWAANAARLRRESTGRGPGAFLPMLVGGALFAAASYLLDRGPGADFEAVCQQAGAPATTPAELERMADAIDRAMPPDYSPDDDDVRRWGTAMTLARAAREAASSPSDRAQGRLVQSVQTELGRACA